MTAGSVVVTGAGLGFAVDVVVVRTADSGDTGPALVDFPVVGGAVVDRATNEDLGTGTVAATGAGAGEHVKCVGSGLRGEDVTVAGVRQSRGLVVDVLAERYGRGDPSRCLSITLWTLRAVVWLKLPPALSLVSP